MKVSYGSWRKFGESFFGFQANNNSKPRFCHKRLGGELGFLSGILVAKKSTNQLGFLRKKI